MMKCKTSDTQINYKSGCALCGEDLFYNDIGETQSCSICGQSSITNIICKEGHYVCDKCHTEKGKIAVNKVCKNSISINPLNIVTEIMSHSEVNMHRPEHHYIVACALVTAYCNASKKGDSSEDYLREVIMRGEKVPGGTCGFWGVCGASISAGIFVSTIMNVTPLSVKNYGIPSILTADISKQIADVGGPRCCKRNSYLAIIKSVERIDQLTGIKLEVDDQISCEFNQLNEECITARCPFWKK